MTAQLVEPSDGYFDEMAAVAERHWWYRARRALVAQLLTGRVGAGCVAADVGCGTGETLRTLTDLGFATVVGADLSTYVTALGGRSASTATRIIAAAEALPLASGTACCLTSLDVLEHLPDDEVAMRELARVLRPGGTLLLMAPAYRWLWSEHDVRACHHRRYTVRQLTALVRRAGLDVERSTYSLSFIVPAAALLRRTPLRRLVSGSDCEGPSGSAAVDWVLGRLAAIERRLARRVRVPFGLTAVVVARKAPSRWSPALGDHETHRPARV